MGILKNLILLVLKSAQEEACLEKVRASIEWPKLKSVHNVQSFFGLALYYRFVRGFSKMVHLLVALMRVGVEWEWSTS